MTDINDQEIIDIRLALYNMCDRIGDLHALLADQEARIERLERAAVSLPFFEGKKI